jgi:hypothetical protein
VRRGTDEEVEGGEEGEGAVGAGAEAAAGGGGEEEGADVEAGEDGGEDGGGERSVHRRRGRGAGGVDRIWRGHGGGWFGRWWRIRWEKRWRFFERQAKPWLLLRGSFLSDQLGPARRMVRHGGWCLL